MSSTRSIFTVVLSLAAGCHIETRPPADVARTQSTIQAAITEHYRARNAVPGDLIELRVTRRQVDVHRDLASVWVTLEERRRVSADSIRDTTRYEHLLLRSADGGWIVLSATLVSAP